MNRWIGWLLAVAAMVAGGVFFGWKGVILALTGVVFWLLLQFSQLMRVMRAANESPLGHVDSALMLQSRLRPGLPLLELLKLTRSLGEKCPSDEAGLARYRWTDPGGDALEIELRDSRVARWELRRGSAPLAT